MTSTLNVTKKKQYTLTLHGSVQDVGFRGYVQELSKRFSLGGIVYNIGDNEMKILCEGDRKTINQFYKEIKRYTLAKIKDVRIEEGLQVPYPMYRAVLTLEQEIYGKLDQGVRLLSDINGNVVDMHKDMKSGFGGVNKNIGGMRKDMKSGFKSVEKVLKGISKKL